MTIRPIILGLMLGTFSLSGSLRAAEQEGLLFAADFKQSQDATFAGGDPAVASGSAQPGEEGGHFGRVPESGSYKPMTFAREGNLDLDKGTLELWVKPEEEESSEPVVRYLFELPLADSNQSGQQQRIVVAITGAPGAHILNVFHGDLENGAAIGKNISWEPGQWHHFALTWNEHQVRVYFDGQQIADEKTEGGLLNGNQSAKEKAGPFFSIGGLTGSDITRSIRGVITGVKIYDHPIYDGPFQPER